MPVGYDSPGRHGAGTGWRMKRWRSALALRRCPLVVSDLINDPIEHRQELFECPGLRQSL